MPVATTILVINTGSSSIKFQLFQQETQQLVLICKGMIQEITSNPVFSANHVQRSTEHQHTPSNVRTHEDGIRHILEWLTQQTLTDYLAAVSHRVVHGGAVFKTSVLVTNQVLATLKTLCPFAPLHQNHNIKGIEIIQELKPNLPQIACFDTAFHATHAPLFVDYALPESIRALGVRRFGFHGLSYEWIVHNLREKNDPLAQQRIVAAHLGNGASLCAINAGVSIDTTMGLTALDGLPMGTRCGSLDPGAILYLARHQNLSIDEIENILYTESGLKGLSNLSHDVRLLQQSKDPKAQFALEYFCLKTAQMIGMMMISLGGMDGLIFTGGIGENAPLLRDRIISHLDMLKPFEQRVIPANEEKIMAMHALQTLKSK